MSRISLKNWTKIDDNNILRGPEIKVAMTTAEGETTIHKIADWDIFDKKKAQKILRLSAADFSGLEDAIGYWAVPHSQQ
jgi:hypothetical protein